MDVTPDTVNFMILGYAVIFGVIGLYLASMALRFRNLRNDERTLDELEKKE